MLRQVDMPLDDLPPLTAEDHRETRAALERMRHRREALLAARGGRLFPESAEEIAAMRAERDGRMA